MFLKFKPNAHLLSGTSTPSGKKRSLSPVEGKDGWKDGEIKEERDGKRARVEGVQLEAQLELKITANAGGRLKLEKVRVLLLKRMFYSLYCIRSHADYYFLFLSSQPIVYTPNIDRCVFSPCQVVQQLVEERLRVLQLTVFDRNLQELKDRMEKIDVASKQQKSVQYTIQVSTNLGPCCMHSFTVTLTINIQNYLRFPL